MNTRLEVGRVQTIHCGFAGPDQELGSVVIIKEYVPVVMYNWIHTVLWKCLWLLWRQRRDEIHSPLSKRRWIVLCVSG